MTQALVPGSGMSDDRFGAGGSKLSYFTCWVLAEDKSGDIGDKALARWQGREADAAKTCRIRGRGVVLPLTLRLALFGHAASLGGLTGLLARGSDGGDGAVGRCVGEDDGGVGCYCGGGQDEMGLRGWFCCFCTSSCRCHTALSLVLASCYSGGQKGQC